MSATAAAQSQSERPAGWAPVAARAFLVVFSVCTIGALGAWAVLDWGTVTAMLPATVLWAIVAAAGDVLVVDYSDRINLTMSLPVTLAAGMVLPPVSVGLLAFVASADPREFRHEVQLERGLFNRSQVAMAALGASLVFHSFGISTSDWPAVLVPAAMAVAADCFLNLTLVSVATGLIQHVSPAGVVRRVVLDVPVQYVLTYGALGLLGLLMATVAIAVGMWGVIAFLAPLALARQTMVEARKFREASRASSIKEKALLSSCERIVDERRDERMAVAGELHDEILPPLFKVHLLAHVMKQDLNSGRLLNLDDDLPELVKATKAAQDAVRLLVGDLRRSPFGPGGLNGTLRLRAEELETAGSPKIVLELDDDQGVSRLSQLLAYQVVREALVNAARHSRASLIRVRTLLEDGVIRVSIEDDGIGFDPRTVDVAAHFGSLQLVTELLEAARGRVVVDSRLGHGTLVWGVLPVDV